MLASERTAKLTQPPPVLFGRASGHASGPASKAARSRPGPVLFCLPLDVAVKTATRVLDGLVASGIAVEIARRSKRRLFGLKGIVLLADAVRPPTGPNPAAGVAGRRSSRWKSTTSSPGPRRRCHRSRRSSAAPSTTATSSWAWRSSTLVLRRTRRSLDELVLCVAHIAVACPSNSGRVR